MSTIPERQELATAKYEDAASVVSDIANGDETTEVPTESGPTPTIKKWMKDRDAQLGSIEINADRAEAALEVAQQVSGIYADTAAGLAATTTGKYFYIPSTTSSEGLILYRNSSGTAIDTGKRTVSSGAVNSISADIATIADRSTERFFDGGKVYKASVDSEGRVSVATMEDGTVKIPKLELPAPAISVVQALINASIADTATIDAIRPTTALGALAQASRRRVDFVMIGDSNQRKDGYGWGGGLMRALHDRFGCYATAVAAQTPITLSSYALTGELTYGLSGAATASGAPPGVESVFPSYSFNIDGSPSGMGCGWLADGLTISAGASGGGASVAADHAIGISNLLRVHYGWVSVAEGAGKFQVAARLNDSPFTTIASSPVTQTNTGEYSLHRQTLDIPAAPRTKGIECKWYIQNSQVLTGPFAAAWLRFENPSKSNGVSVSTFYGAGGQSLYDMANYIVSAPDRVLINWFGETRRLQLIAGQKPLVVVYVNSGLNDQNETLTPSFGWRASTDASSPAAYIDNLEAIAKRISDVWQKAGWDQEELFFLVMPSHPVSNPDAAKLISYRKAAYSFAQSRQRASFIDMALVANADEMVANNWYMGVNNSDPFHLVQDAYRILGARIVANIPELDV